MCLKIIVFSNEHASISRAVSQRNDDSLSFVIKTQCKVHSRYTVTGDFKKINKYSDCVRGVKKF